MCLYSSNDNLWYNEGGISLPVTKTVLAKDIDMENLDIRYDKSVRRILVNIPILARIIKPVVTELQYYQLPVIEKCIDKNSIQIGKVFVEPGLTNKKIINDELEDKVPYEGRIIYDIRFSIILPDGSSRKIIINKEHNIPMTIELEKEMSYMCNLSSGIREEAIRDGIMIGEHNGEINALKNMLKANLVTIEKLKSSGLYSPDVLAALSN